MSRVHDALRKAANEIKEAATPSQSRAARAAVAQALSNETETGSPATAPEQPLPQPSASEQPPRSELRGVVSGLMASAVVADDANRADLDRLDEIILQAPTVPFKPAPDALLVSPSKPKDAPAEEFRSLRTRLNHLQRSQPLHTLVVTSASPGEGKSFTACNLAMSQAQLTGKRILLADFDFRRPSIDKTFGMA